MAEPPLPHFWEGPIVLRNPFVVYVATFAGALAVYQLGWSEILPPLSLEVATFFGVSFAIAALLGKLIQPAVANIGAYRPGLLPSYARSEARRVGHECVSTCRSRWSRYHKKKKKN